MRRFTLLLVPSLLVLSLFLMWFFGGSDDERIERILGRKIEKRWIVESASSSSDLMFSIHLNDQSITLDSILKRLHLSELILNSQSDDAVKIRERLSFCFDKLPLDLGKSRVFSGVTASWYIEMAGDETFVYVRANRF